MKFYYKERKVQIKLFNLTKKINWILITFIL